MAKKGELSKTAKASLAQRDDRNHMTERVCAKCGERIMLKDRSTHEIADNLILGASTIRWHIKNIYAKLSVHNRPQLLTQARELGII